MTPPILEEMEPIFFSLKMDPSYFEKTWRHIIREEISIDTVC